MLPKDGVCNIEGAYERFRDITTRTYKNMFSSNDLCVNEPQQSHWNFVLVLVKEKTIIVRDSMFNEDRFGQGTWRNNIQNLLSRKHGTRLPETV